MPTLFKVCLIVVSALISGPISAYAQSSRVSNREKIVVTYPSKSITNFPILQTARQKGFFQREHLDVALVYIRGGLDIKTLLRSIDLRALKP